MLTLKYVPPTISITYIFSVSLKFRVCYTMGQWGEFIVKKRMLIHIYIYFLGIFLLFFIKKCVFIIFISFSDEVSNFHKSILISQKLKLVIRNCQRNYMKSSNSLAEISQDYLWDNLLQNVVQNFLNFLSFAFY